MNADKVEHRGVIAFQSVYNNYVLLVRDGTLIARYRTVDTKTADELRSMIDEHLDGGGNNEQNRRD